MEILIVSATPGEVEPLQQHLATHWVQSGNRTYTHGQMSVEILITGLGMVRTAFTLGVRLAGRKPALCVNAGIAGAFPGKFNIGDVVHIVEDNIAEMGARDAHGHFLTPLDMGLNEDIDSHVLVNPEVSEYRFLPFAKGITVNTVHGDQRAISEIIDRYDPDLETMESGAFFYACLKSNVPFLAIRAVSNIVEPRNRDSWDIPLAIRNLNAQLIEMLDLLKG